MISNVRKGLGDVVSLLMYLQCAHKVSLNTMKRKARSELMDALLRRSKETPKCDSCSHHLAEM